MSTDDINTTDEIMGADDCGGITSIDSAVHVKAMQITEDIPEEDVHICAKCKIPFTSLEKYFEHKMTNPVCGKEFNNTRKNLLKRLGPRRGRPPGRKRQYHDSTYTPAIVKKETVSEESTSSHESKVKSAEKGDKYNRLKLHHRMSDIIPNTVMYKCDQCDSQFKREAALKRHKEYDHREKDSDESSEDECLYRDNILGVNKQQLPDGADSSDITQLSVPTSQVQYLETLTFDQATGLCTTSTIPAVIETSAACVLPMAEQKEDSSLSKQVLVFSDGKGKQDPDYVENRINYMMSRKRYPRIRVSGRRGTQHGSKTNVCNRCGRSFANALTLSTHQLTHSNIRNFKCTVPGCSYAFKTKGSLKRHMRRHTGERPYKCKLCHRAFRESGALNRHLKGRVPCTDKTDADFPRYKKNLKLPTAVTVPQDSLESNNEQEAGDASSNAATDQNGVVLENETESRSENMIIIVPVSILDNGQENETITAESQCSLYDSSQVLPEQMMMVTVSEDELSTNQGLSLVIEDNCQNGEGYPEVSQEEIAASAENSSANNQLEETDDVLIDPLLEREEGELIEVKGEEPLIVGSEECGRSEEDNSGDGESFVCKVDGERFANHGDLINHLKTHLMNVNYHCEKCNYFSQSQDQMDEHVQLTHFKEWIAQPPKTEISNISEKENDPNTEHIQFVASEAQMTEEVVSHGDEINVAISSLSTAESADLPEDGDTVTESIQYSENLDGVMSTKNQQQTERNENCPVSRTADVPDNAASSDENIKLAITALEQLMSLYQSSDSHHDYCQFDKSQCPVCGKKFKGQAYLKFHVRIHTGEKAFKCDQCIKSFATKDALNKHYMAHSMDKNYKCGECGKFFKRISHVKEHLKVHTNERPYTCKLCLKTFKTVNACKVHIRTHSDELQYKCDMCNKQFREKGSLDRHIRTHTGEKPYPCPHCGRKFAEHGTLNRHLKAKVPCTRALQQLLLSNDVSQLMPQPVHLLAQDKDSISITSEGLQLTELSQAVKLENLEEGAEMKRQHVKLHILPDGQVKEEAVIGSDETTVLREFSSVVADTQQYIMDPQQQDNTEYIMVSEAQAEVMMQDSAKDIENDKTQEQVGYIVMGNDNVIFIDQKSGEEIQLLTSSDQDNKTALEAMEVVTTDVQQVIEMPPGEEVIAMETDAGELMLGEC